MKNASKIIELKTEGCCEPAAWPTLNPAQAEETASLFAALADPTRLAILNLLAGSREAVCVCDITASFTLGQPTISHHLKILRDAGLLTGDKRGKWVYYSLVAHRVEAIKEQLDRVVALTALV
jgi:ArsR family transcriptional regulator